MKFVMNIHSSCANINPNTLVPRGRGFLRDNALHTPSRGVIWFPGKRGWNFTVYAHIGALLTAVVWPRGGICIHMGIKL